MKWSTTIARVLPSSILLYLRIKWCCHGKEKDAANPHCHLVFRDRDVTTGKNVFGTSDRGSTLRLRGLWEDHANCAAAEKGRRPVSRPRNFRNGAWAKSPSRRVDYPRLGQGRTRADYNRERPTEPDYWRELDARRQREELDGLRHLHLPPDGQREEPLPRSFSDKLREFRERKEADKAALSRAPKAPTGTPVQQALPLKEVLGKGRDLGRGSPVRSVRKVRDDERER